MHTRNMNYKANLYMLYINKKNKSRYTEGTNNKNVTALTIFSTVVFIF